MKKLVTFLMAALYAAPVFAQSADEIEEKASLFWRMAKYFFPNIASRIENPIDFLLSLLRIVIPENPLLWLAWGILVFWITTWASRNSSYITIRWAGFLLLSYVAMLPVANAYVTWHIPLLVSVGVMVVSLFLQPPKLAKTTVGTMLGKVLGRIRLWPRNILAPAQPTVMPGQVPGMLPGTVPGQVPGMLPGVVPGQVPALMPGQVQPQLQWCQRCQKHSVGPAGCMYECEKQVQPQLQWCPRCQKHSVGPAGCMYECEKQVQPVAPPDPPQTQAQEPAQAYQSILDQLEDADDDI